ncbi:hypothetical protein L798_09316 [Zootermopsis nevadensis]|uniref:CCHC-type domain-containing protein n=1 Tax=Zootermopsis nevadensis TaxID=136037 RepID=A0A067R266_ZOONE|nr:hypothetical protein L798_09316 [Zootermopsis nevadensis]
MPANMDEAVRLAVTIENAEQQKTSERQVFTTAEVVCYQCNQKGHIARNCRSKSFQNQGRGRFLNRNRFHSEGMQGRGRGGNNSYFRTEPRCTYCHSTWHYRGQCPKMSRNPKFNRERNSPSSDPNSSGSANRPPPPSPKNGGMTRRN